ncbi:2-hydroxychromene-2-carboxylate isomerase [Pseudahrensia aquimaris]|uniref:2-hydroxychromene-2-carboxylate isomerase n=1 Tax=Pseudahrensia aquimaris TaxID=744461 RepID=A0ABW3FF73_9HYPH
MQRIEYVYSAHSAFAYIGSKRLMEICARHGVQLVHRPVLLSPVVEAQGSLPFRARTQAHVDYFFGREIERWAQYRHVPVVNFRPTHHDADYSLASGMIIALGDSGEQVDAMAHAVLQAHWQYDADLSDRAALRLIALTLGHDADALLAVAESEAIQQKLQENCVWAKERNIFGSPTYILDGDPYYGQDRLEILEHALANPFAPSGWTNPSVN